VLWFRRGELKLRIACPLIALIPVFFISWASSAQTCPDLTSTCPVARQNCGGGTGLYTLTQPAGSIIPASSIFCGQERKYGNNLADANNFDLIDPTNVPWCLAPATQVPASSTCGGLLWPGTSPCIPNVAVTNPNAPHFVKQKVEIRGWTAPNPGLGPHDDEEEHYSIDIILDTGWTTTAANVTPLNSIQAIADNIPPYNVIFFGGRPIDSTSRAYGGAGRAVVHVEPDGWGPKRACNDRTPLGFGPTATNLPCSYDYRYGHNPATYDPTWNQNYTNTFNSTFGNYWPFSFFPPDNTELVGDVPGSYTGENGPSDPGQLSIPGDYVRIVGTLWLDGLHFNAGHPAGVDNAFNCWNAGPHSPAPSWGYAEIHPVDFIAKICPPSHPHTVVAYALCDNDYTTSFVYEAVQPPGLSVPPELRMRDTPFPNSVLSVTKASPNFWSPPNGLNHSVATISGQQVQFDINGSGFEPYFYDLEFYDLSYSCSRTCTNTCNTSDGCGGNCGNSCSSGLVCPASGTGTCVPHCVTAISAANVTVPQGSVKTGTHTTVTTTQSASAESFSLSGFPPVVTSGGCSNCPVTAGVAAKASSRAVLKLSGGSLI